MTNVYITYLNGSIAYSSRSAVFYIVSATIAYTKVQIAYSGRSAALHRVCV